MPTRYSKQNELQQLQYEITNEISRDAKPIADGVFGNNARHPDMATVSNQELDQIYRDAYARNDRTFLMQEAQRDPQQFLDVTDRIGVPDPPTDPSGKPIPPPEHGDELAQQLTQQAVQNAVQAGTVPPSVPPPAALPAPVVPAVPAPPVPAPIPMVPPPAVPQPPIVQQPPIVGGQ